jgi:hypothetical protein
MDFTDRPLTGYVYVSGDGTRTDVARSVGPEGTEVRRHASEDEEDPTTSETHAKAEAA